MRIHNTGSGSFIWTKANSKNRAARTRFKTFIGNYQYYTSSWKFWPAYYRAAIYENYYCREALHQFFKVLGAGANTIHGRPWIGLLFNVPVFHSGFFGLGKYTLVINRTGSNVCVPVLVRPFHILHMPLLETLWILFKVLDWISSRTYHPIDVHFDSDVFGIEFG